MVVCIVDRWAVAPRCVAGWVRPFGHACSPAVLSVGPCPSVSSHACQLQCWHCTVPSSQLPAPSKQLAGGDSPPQCALCTHPHQNGPATLTLPRTLTHLPALDSCSTRCMQPFCRHRCPLLPFDATPLTDAFCIAFPGVGLAAQQLVNDRCTCNGAASLCAATNLQILELFHHLQQPSTSQEAQHHTAVPSRAAGWCRRGCTVGLPSRTPRYGPPLLLLCLQCPHATSWIAPLARVPNGPPPCGPEGVPGGLEKRSRVQD